MKITALLPMKGHSERVPNKNMRAFAARPLFHCVANVLEQSELIQSIIINTDSTAIGEYAVSNFSKTVIHERPEKIRGDMVSMNKIIDHDLEHSKGEHFIQTHSTNPLLTVDTLNRAINLYFRMIDKYDSVFSVTKIQTRLYFQNGEPVNHNPTELIRTQDLPPLFEENSNFYIFSKTSFANAGKRRIGLKPNMFAVEPLEAIDIDEENDFIIAELIYQYTNNMQ